MQLAWQRPRVPIPLDTVLETGCYPGSFVQFLALSSVTCFLATKRCRVVSLNPFPQCPKDLKQKPNWPCTRWSFAFPAQKFIPPTSKGQRAPKVSYEHTATA